ncbi:MAG: N-acetyltransferase [Phycisphaerales bacterium]|nr:MAG: N-acetyltransferase [Phycisphaerales bacterium]
MLEEWRQARGVAEIAVEHEPLAGGTMAYSAPGSCSNQASGLGLRAPVTVAELDRLVAYYRERNEPAAIEVAPFADVSLVHGLRERGFLLKDFEMVFATRVEPGEDCRARMTVALDPSVEVRRYEPGDAASDRAFLLASMSGFVPEGQTEPNEGDLEVGLNCLRHPRTVNVAAYAEGRIVGAGAMELATDVPDEHNRPTAIACFFGVSVVPEYRRRGIQQAMIAARLQVCADAGCELACIHAHPGVGTERNALRMGFQHAYTKVTLIRPLEGSPSRDPAHGSIG